MADSDTSESSEETTPAEATAGPIRGDLVATATLQRAAANLAASLPEGWTGKVVVTTDADLVDSFATARQVAAAIDDQLTRADVAIGTPPGSGKPPTPQQPVNSLGVSEIAESITKTIGVAKEIVAVFTPTISTTVQASTPAEFELVSTVVDAVRRAHKDVSVSSDTTRVLDRETAPLDKLAQLEQRVATLRELKSKAEADLAKATPKTETDLTEKVAKYDAAVTTATTFLAQILAVPADGAPSPLITAIRRLSIGEAWILVVQATEGSVQQSAVTRFGRTPEYVIDGFARIPFALLKNDGLVETSGVATASTSYYTAFDTRTMQLRWAPVVDAPTAEPPKRSPAAIWLKALAAVVAALVLVAAFSLPLVVTDLGWATDTDAPLDHLFHALSLTATSAWQFGILIAPLVAALLSLTVRSGPNAALVAFGAAAVAILAGVAQPLEFGLSHLLVYLGGAWVPAVLLVIAGALDFANEPRVGLRERFRRRF